MEFNVYKDKRGEWRWQLVAANGRVIGDSGEGYTDKGHCIAMVNRSRDEVAEAKVTIIDSGGSK